MAKITRIATQPDGSTTSYAIDAASPLAALGFAVVNGTKASFFAAEQAAADFAAAKGGVVAKVATYVAPRFAKGSRVSFVDKGAKVFAVVESQRADMVTVVWGDLGARIPAHELTAEAAVALPDAGRMSRYSVRSYKRAAFASQETDCYEAIIDVDGRPAVRMANEGTGGSDMVDGHVAGAARGRDMAAHAAAREAASRFCADAKAWCAENGMDVGSYCEPTARWLDWARNKRPLGVTAREFCAAWEAGMADLRGPSKA